MNVCYHVFILLQCDSGFYCRDRIRQSKGEREMDYYFQTTLSGEFDAVVEKVSEALSKESFGVLTEIDVKETLKKKLDMDFRRYRILGACNPPFAHKALTAEPHIGLMLPCNVVVQEGDSEKIIVSAIDPVASMQAVSNPRLKDIAGEVRTKLKNVIESL